MAPRRWLAVVMAGVALASALASPRARGRAHLTPVVLARPALLAASAPSGYWVVDAGGGVSAFGGTKVVGSGAPLHLKAPVSAIAATQSGAGYWMATSDGGVFTFGDARFAGSAAGAGLETPVVAIVPTETEHGYWLVTSGAEVARFGDAPELPRPQVAAPIVAAARTPSGDGMWLADIAGSVHPLGDAVALPRPDPGPQSTRPLVGIAPTPSGHGYWLAYVDGAVAAVGDASHLGSLEGVHLAGPIVGIVASASGGGYLLVAADGGVFRFGDAPYAGSAVGAHPGGPAIGVVMPGTATGAGAAVQLGLLSAKTFALTFDDGPNPRYTLPLLAVLQQKHVLATFFEIGRLVETNPALTAALAAAGDVIGNHTYNHAYLTTLTPSAFDSELDRTSQVIAQVAGRAPRCLRPPYGATNSSVQARLTARGLAQQMWTVDPSDYKVPPVSQLVTAVVGSAAPGGVVILHDGGGDRSHTVAAVSQIIDGLRAAGFTLVPVCW